VSFLSIDYYLLLFVILVVYYLLKKIHHRLILLTFVSYLFYMSWRIEFGILLLTSTLIDYFTSKRMVLYPDDKNKRKRLLRISIFSNLGILFLFKYGIYLIKTSDRFGDIEYISQLPSFWFLFPVGISFYTFQTLGYTIDVYRKRIRPEKDFISFSAFVSFFPQLVAGPIEKAGRLLPQLKTLQKAKRDNFMYGTKRIIHGLFKKFVLSNTFALYVDPVFQNPENYKGLRLYLAVFYFTAQIYCDFSGYCDIAIGSARLFGIRLMENFKNPALSISISDFWSRWHISLSTWFKDYLFPYLAPKGSSRARMLFSICLILLLSGLWHGAKLNYIMWGAVFSLYFIIFNLFGKPVRRLSNRVFKKRSMYRRLIQNSILGFFISLSAVFFRADTFDSAIYIYSNMFDDLLIQLLSLKKGFHYLFDNYIQIPGFNIPDFILTSFFFLYVGLIQFYYEKLSEIGFMNSKYSNILKIIFYFAMFFMTILFININHKDFYYFQF